MVRVLLTKSQDKQSFSLYISLNWTLNQKSPFFLCKSSYWETDLSFLMPGRAIAEYPTVYPVDDNIFGVHLHIKSKTSQSFASYFIHPLTESYLALNLEYSWIQRQDVVSRKLARK